MCRFSKDKLIIYGERGGSWYSFVTGTLSRFPRKFPTKLLSRRGVLFKKSATLRGSAGSASLFALRNSNLDFVLRLALIPLCAPFFYLLLLLLYSIFSLTLPRSFLFQFILFLPPPPLPSPFAFFPLVFLHFLSLSPPPWLFFIPFFWTSVKMFSGSCEQILSLFICLKLLCCSANLAWKKLNKKLIK